MTAGGRRSPGRCVASARPSRRAVEARRRRAARARRRPRGGAGTRALGGRGGLVDRAARRGAATLEVVLERRARGGRLRGQWCRAAGSARWDERGAGLRRAALPLGLLVPGRRLPARRAGRRAPRRSATGALALTDHDNLCGALAFAHAAHELGLRPITGCELTVDGRRRAVPPHAAGRDRGRLRNLCAAADRGARRHRRPKPARRGRRRRRSTPSRARRRADLPDAAAPRHGALLGARRGARAAPRRGRLLRGPSARRGCGSSCSARSGAATGRGCARCVELGARARRPGRGHERRARARAPRAAPLQDALVAIRSRAAARGLRGASAAATASTCSSRRPRWRRCSPTCRRRSAERRRSPSAAASTSPATSATATRPPTTRSADRELRGSAPHALRAALPAAGPAAREAAAAAEEELELIRHHRLSGFFLLHREILEMAREVAVRGARPRTRRAWCCRPAAGAAPRSARSSAT